MTAVRATPRRVRASLAVRRYRRAGLIAAFVALLLYLLAIGDIAIGASVNGTGITVVSDWTDRIFRARAPYLFEPVAAVSLAPVLTVLISPVDLVLGSVLAGLMGLNLAAAGYAASQVIACRRTSGYGRLVAALPALLTGAACCVPTFLVVLGSGAAAVLLPIIVPLQPFFYPVSVALLLGTLVWTTRRL